MYHSEFDELEGTALVSIGIGAGPSIALRNIYIEV